MRVLILGGDGYLGWPTSMNFAANGHEVLTVDNYMRRHIAMDTDSLPLFDNPLLDERAALYEKETGHKINVRIGDLADFRFVESVFSEFKPDCIIHYAEQPSAPYSMRGFEEAKKTFDNNLGATFNIIWGMLNHCPDAHMVKLGTMGEYGTPNIDIEEGYLDIEHKGRKDKFLFPRQAGSLYHTTKVLDTDLLYFYCRVYGLRVTDLMQGPVYGVVTDETTDNPALWPNFHYDDQFGTLINRFLVQAVAGVPLTVYGKGGQTRGYLDVRDTLQCVMLAANSPAEKGQLKIYNQFVEQFSVNQIADKVVKAGKELGIDVAVNPIDNPRKEMEDHYYNAQHSGLLELGLKPHYLTDEEMVNLLKTVLSGKDRIVERRIMPRVVWNKK